MSRALAVLALTTAAASWPLRAGAQDRVLFTNAVPGDPPVILLSATPPAGGFACLRFRPFQGTVVEAPVGDVEMASRCAGELAVFSREQGAVLRWWPALVPNTGGAGQQVVVTLPFRRQLRVVIWQIGAAAAIPCDTTPIDATSSFGGACDINDAMAHAETAFRAGRTGIAFNWDVRTLAPGDPRIAHIGTGCESARDARLGGAFQSGAVNVYWLMDYTPSYTMHGLNCGHLNAQDQVYIWKSEYLGTLAHELGHALGLVTPEAAWGDFWSSSALILPEGNLMRGDVKLVGDMTLGQVYRMNFDRRSFLQWSQPSPFFVVVLYIFGWRTVVLVFPWPFQVNRVCQSDPLSTATTYPWPCPHYGMVFP